MENPIIPGLNIPVRTIYCVGRNFVDHAAEMKSPIPAEPIIFLKPLSSICFNHDVVNIPSASLNVHYEGEIVIAIGKKGKYILLIYSVLNFVLLKIFSAVSGIKG